MRNGNSARPRIAVDTWVLGSNCAHHGVNVYCRKLLAAFRELAPQYSVEVVPYLDNTKPGSSETDYSVAFRPRVTRLLSHSRLWRFGGAQARAALDGADVIFNPHCTTLYVGFPSPVVTTIHDVIPVVLPWKSPHVRTLRFLLWAAARASRAIITVSQHSKSDLIRLYGIDEERIHVVYNGCDHEAFNCIPPEADLLQKALSKIGVERPYLFHCGAIKANKNLKRLILAYRSLLARNPGRDLALILAGTPDSAQDEVAREAAGSGGRVILTGAVDQTDLVLLTKGAELAVFPSLYEGFCMPMVEAMACGVPTIAASVSCLPEISGGVLRYFDPISGRNEYVYGGCFDEQRTASSAVGRRRTAGETVRLASLRRADVRFARAVRRRQGKKRIPDR